METSGGFRGWLRRHLVLDRLSVGLIVFVLLAVLLLGFAFAAGAGSQNSRGTSSTTTHTSTSSSFLSINPSNGAVGTPVEATISGFSCSQGSIAVTFQTSGGTQREIATLPSGRSSLRFQVPSAANGKQEVSATGTGGCAGSASAIFDVDQATISLSHAAGNLSNVVSVSGNGFGSLASINDATICGTAVSNLGIAVNATGSFSGARIALPVSCQQGTGSLELLLVDSDSVRAVSVFNAGGTAFWYCIGTDCTPSSTEPSTTVEIGASGVSTPIVVRVAVSCLNVCDLQYPFSLQSPWNGSSLTQEGTGYTVEPESASNSAGSLSPSGPYSWTNASDVVTVTLSVANRQGNFNSGNLTVQLNAGSGGNLYRGSGALVYMYVSPRVTVTFPAPDGNHGWFTSPTVSGVVSAYQPQTLMDQGSISCNDSLGTPLLSNPVTSPNRETLNETIAVSADGVHQIECTAVDNLGNMGAGPGSSPAPVSLRIDSTPPTVTISPKRSADSNGWYNHPVQFTVSGTDATSGLAGCGAGPVYSGPDNASASVTATCTDSAGNSGSAKYVFKYDATPPTASVVSPWNATTVGALSIPWSTKVNGTASDSVSGIESVEVQLDSGTFAQATTSNGWVLWSSDAVFSSRGIHSITIRATDNAGNNFTQKVSFVLGDAVMFSVSCTPAEVVVNNPASCTTVVSDISATPNTPTGVVNFTTDSPGTFSPSASCALTGTSATAECSVNYTPGLGSEGTAKISAYYSGDSNHAAANAGQKPFSLLVDKRSSTTSVVCSPSSVALGAQASCEATVRASGGVPSGTVSFSAGSGTFQPTSCTLKNGACTVNYTPVQTSGATATVTASYAGDADDSASSGSTSITVALPPTSMTLSCSPGSVPTGTPSTCFVAVSSTGGTPSIPTGLIGFTASASGTFSNPYCTLTGGSCSVTFTPSPGSEGTTTITASYGGDASLGPSSGNFLLTVLGTTSSALSAGAITPSSPTIDSGQSITLTANPSGGTPSYHYSWWTSADCLTTAATGSTDSNTYSTSTAGTYYYKVTDSAASPASACSSGDIVTVDSALVAGAIIPSVPTIDSGQSITLSANPSGGTGLYTYQWYSGASATCSTDTTLLSSTTSTQSVSPTANTYYCYGVTDTSAGTPNGATSSTDFVTVNSALTTPSISTTTPTIDSGQTASFSVSWTSSGTSPYAVTLYYSSSATSCATLGSQIDQKTGQSGSPVSFSESGLTTGTDYICATLQDSANSPEATTTSTPVTVAVNSALVAPVISVSPTTIDSGQSITLAADPSGGTTPYTDQWYTGASCNSIITGQTGATYAASPTSTTTYSYEVTDSASSPASQCSSGDTVTVNSALVAGAITPSAPMIDNGQSITLNANPSGGTTPYSYQWYSGTSAACSSDTTPLGTASTQSDSPTTNTYYCYLVTDSSTGTPVAIATSSTDLVTVDSTLTTPSISTTTPTIDSGQTATFSVSWTSSGTSPYAVTLYYSSSATSCATPGSQIDQKTGQSGSPVSLSEAGLTIGTDYVCATLKDSANSPETTTTSTPVTVAVSSALVAPVISVSPTTIDSGQSSTLSTTTSFSGGTSTYTCQWLEALGSASYSDLGSSFTNGCTTSSSPTIPTGALTTGTWHFELQVTDSGIPAEVVTSNVVTVTVGSALTLSVPSQTIDSGQSATLTATASGGSGSYSTYAFYSGSSCTDTALQSSSSNTYSTGVLTSTTTYCATVTDSLGGTATTTSTVTVSPVLSAGAITPSSPTIDSGQSITLNAAASGGTNPYSYQWYSGTSAACSSDTTLLGTASTQSDSPTSSTYYCYQVTDSASTPVSVESATDLVTVNSALVAGAIAPAAPTIDSGQSVTLYASPSGGTGPYSSYQWYSDGACASAISGATSSSYLASPTVTTTYSYTVTDSASVTSACSSGDTVAVNPVLTAGPITPSAPAIDSGQSVTLYASPSGGTGPYSYQWYTDASCSSPISGATSATYNASPSSTTTYYYQVMDSAYSPVSECSSGDTVTVNPSLAAPTIGVSPGTIDNGQSAALSTTVSFSGGTSPYACQRARALIESRTVTSPSLSSPFSARSLSRSGFLARSSFSLVESQAAFTPS